MCMSARSEFSLCKPPRSCHVPHSSRSTAPVSLDYDDFVTQINGMMTDNSPVESVLYAIPGGIGRPIGFGTIDKDTEN